MSRVTGLVLRILSSLGIIASGIALSAMIFTTLRSLESKNAEASFNGIAHERLEAVKDVRGRGAGSQKLCVTLVVEFRRQRPQRFASCLTLGTRRRRISYYR